MGENGKRVRLDNNWVEVHEGESPDEFLRRNNLQGRQLTKIEPDGERPVRSLGDVQEGDDLGTVAQSQLG